MKANPIVLAFFIFIFPVTVSADLIKWSTTSGVNIFEDTETGLIWQDSFSEYHTFSEAQIACHSSNFGGVLGWDIPNYETMRQFLSAYQSYNPDLSQSPHTLVYDLHHWTTTKIYTTYRRLARLKIDGTIDESSYVDPASSGRRIGGKCYTLLPNNSPNGIATAPEFLKSRTSKQSVLPNEQLYLKSYWVDKDDSFELVRARYKNVYSQDWVQVQATYIEGHPQFEAHYAAQISVQKPGFYEVAYQAVSKDGSNSATSEWVNGGDTFTVEKVGVTSPDFLEAHSEDVSDLEDNHKRFTATWSDTDGDPFIFFGKFRYRAKGSSAWSEAYSMTDSGSFGDTKTFTAEHSFDDADEGVYEIQFQASSASDFNGFDAVESAWSPSAPITFELLDSRGASNQASYACNIVHNPISNQRWAIKNYNLGNLSAITSEMVFSVSNNRKIQSVACAPDGKTVFFSMKETLGGDYEIYQLDVESRRLEQITNNGTDDFDVTRSADGLTLAWQKRLPDNRQAIELRRTAPDGSLIKKTLGSASPYVQPSLSANGKWLVFVQLRPNNFIVLRYDIENDRYKQVRSVLRRKKLYHPSISDDGNLVGWSELVSKRRYRVKNLTENTTTDVLNHSAGIEHAELSANGESVFYSINDSVISQALVTSLDTQETNQITYFDNGVERNIGNTWSSDLIFFQTED